MNNQVLKNILSNCTYTDTVTSSINWSDCAANNTTTTALYVRQDEFDNKINELTCKLEVPAETKTKLNVNNGKVYVKNYEDGFFKNERFIISDIKDVRVYNHVVMVTFADNTTTKAVLDPEDEFSLEQGISICITKKLLGNDGNAIYNKLIKRAFDVKKQNEKASRKAEEEKIAEQKRKEKVVAFRKKKKEKKREEQISMYAEAFTRAMKAIGGKCKCNKNK